jgi:predicted DNA-binding ribbon-helix-helix protein
MKRASLPLQRKRRGAHRRPSLVVKRTISAERKMTVTLEDAFWNALKEIAVSKKYLTLKSR